VEAGAARGRASRLKVARSAGLVGRDTFNADRGGGGCRDDGRTRGDRLLSFGCWPTTHRQRLRLDLTPEEGRPRASSPLSGWPAAWCSPSPSADLGHLGRRRAGRRSRRLRGTARVAAGARSPSSRSARQLSPSAGRPRGGSGPGQPARAVLISPTSRATKAPPARCRCRYAVGGGRNQPAEGHGDQSCHRSDDAPESPGAGAGAERPAGRARASPPTTTPVSPTSAATMAPSRPALMGLTPASATGWTATCTASARHARIGLT